MATGRELCEDITSYAQEHEGLTPVLIDIKTLARPALLSEVVERASTEVYPVDPPWLSDALVYIRKHIANRPTASEVYAHLERSHTTVDIAFRKALGTTVQKTIAATRIEAARQLLRTSDLSIAQIAARCGFASQEYFSRSFAKAAGTAPGIWRLGRPVG